MDKYYLEDKLLKNENQDKFGHRNLANVLYDLVVNQHNKNESNEQQSFNIGIFGKWGVGKSSIVELVRKKIENNELLTKQGDKKTCNDKNKIAYIKIPVWKYTKQTDSLRRKFILKIAKNLNISTNEVKKDIYTSKDFDEPLVKLNIFKEFKNKKNFPKMNKLLFALAFFIFGFGFLTKFETILMKSFLQNAWSIIIVIIPVLVVIINWFLNALQSSKMKISFAQYDSIEQFEDEFIKRVDQRKCRKLIFIDDLDRCPKEKVIETLETIKAFLNVKGCIFIIACDQEVIEECINKTNSIYRRSKHHNGRQYLEKFFQYTITIPPFIRRDLRTYAKEILLNQKSKLAEINNCDSILDVLIHDHIEDPRKVIILINNFISDYLVAVEREKDKELKLTEGTITNNLAFLAKIAVLKHEFPNFYKEFCKNNDLINWINVNAENQDQQLEDYQKQSCLRSFDYTKNKISDNDDGKQDIKIEFDKKIKQWLTAVYDEDDEERYELFCFLIRTRNIGSEIKDKRPFIYLTQDKSLYGLENEKIDKIFISLKSGFENTITELLSEDKDKEMISESILTLIEEFRDLDLSNSIIILSKCIESFSESTFKKASKLLINKSLEPQNDIKTLSSNGLLFACDINKANKDRIIGKLIDILDIEKEEDHSKHDTLLRSLFNYEYLVTAISHIDKIKKYIEERTIEVEDEEEKQYDVEYYADSIMSLPENHNVIKKFFDGQIPERIVEALAIEDRRQAGDEETPKYIILKNAHYILVKTIFENDKKRLFTAISYLMDNSNLFWENFTLLEEHIEDLTQYTAKLITESLIKYIPQTSEIARKKTIISVINIIINKYSLEDVKIDNLENEILALFDSPDEEYYKFGFLTLTENKIYFSDSMFAKLANNFIQRIDPENSLDKSNVIISLVKNYYADLTDENLNALCILSKQQIFNHIKVLNDNNYNFWKKTLLFSRICLIINILKNFLNPMNLISS